MMMKSMPFFRPSLFLIWLGASFFSKVTCKSCDPVLSVPELSPAAFCRRPSCPIGALVPKLLILPHLQVYKYIYILYNIFYILYYIYIYQALHSFTDWQLCHHHPPPSHVAQGTRWSGMSGIQPNFSAHGTSYHWKCG